uniref:Serine/threonine-protein phosphatase n=1 Tax=Brugia malayi TaxID=6279 RepID=A0A0H5SGV7_BRUMA|nr:Bm9015 [Brugia malayi]
MSQQTDFSLSSENYVNTMRMAPLRCPLRPCTQQALEHYMSRVMQLMSGTNRIHTTFEHHEIIEIIHGCLTIFADEPTLLQFPLPENGLVIIGDLHGDAFCLLKAFEFYGFPPNITYLFLGDILDRGPMQNEILLFVFLMKLRWPEYVYLLRGNHELYHLTEQYFKNQCLTDYNNPFTFIYINQLFDYLPLAAIVSDYFFFCHAGVSQWMTCRANIANIPRPTDLNNMKILEGCIITDILWSDPKPNQRSPFDLSERGCCYSFNREALHAVLRALNVRTLIRGHQIIPEGILDNFGDGSCITVHTATRESAGCNSSGTIKIVRKDDGKFVMEKRMAKINSKKTMNNLCDTVYALLCESLQRSRLNRIVLKCQWCRKAYPRNITRRIRNSGIAEITLWISRYAFRYAQYDEIFHLFVTSSDFELVETLANDVDPGLLEIQQRRSKPNLLRRTSWHVRNMLRHAIGLRDLPSLDDTDVSEISRRP